MSAKQAIYLHIQAGLFEYFSLRGFFRFFPGFHETARQAPIAYIWLVFSLDKYDSRIHGYESRCYRLWVIPVYELAHFANQSISAAQLGNDQYGSAYRATGEGLG